eukprot:6214202-Alexandrium_andersonii.AAC.1
MASPRFLSQSTTTYSGCKRNHLAAFRSSRTYKSMSGCRGGCQDDGTIHLDVNCTPYGWALLREPPKKASICNFRESRWSE